MKQLLLCLVIFSAFSCKTTKAIKAPPKVSKEQTYDLNLKFKSNSEYVSDMEQFVSM